MMEEYDSGVGSIGSPMEPASPVFEAYRVSLSSLRTALSQLCEEQGGVREGGRREGIKEGGREGGR